MYLLVRNNNNIDLLNYYKRYTKELSKKIREAKKEYYNTMIKQSKNKIVTTWKIIKVEKGKTCTKDNIIKMEVNGSVTCNPQIIAHVMNQYFYRLVIIISSTKLRLTVKMLWTTY